MVEVAGNRASLEAYMVNQEIGELPIVETGPVAEYFVDYIGPVRIVGPNFWVTFGRFLVPAGMSTEAKVPIVRIGRTLDTYRPNQLAGMIETEKTIIRMVWPHFH